MRSVNFARKHDLLVAVRGGGHNIAGNALCEGGFLIDLSLMRSVHVNPSTRTARVEPGATLGDLDHETQAFSLATPVGINSTTGIAGLTLGGGFGWLSRKHGLTIDNLLSADVVTAKGERITATETEHPDLFWGIRGGGGNFGIVTSFEFKLHTDDAIDTVLQYASTLPSDQSEIFIAQLGGAVNRVAADATAYEHRDVAFVMNVHTRWTREEEDKDCIDWARKFFDATAPFATGGVYVNFMTEEETGRVEAAYGKNYGRMVSVKKKYDPDNLFRLNQNISPAGPRADRSKTKRDRRRPSDHLDDASL